MSMPFWKPVGSCADVKELEYIAALHQTEDTAGDSRFVDGSLSASDVKRFLKSRYGIRVSAEQVRSTILRGLGGGDGEDECIDLCEVTAILLIPLLLRCTHFSAADGEDENGVVERKRDTFVTEYEYRAFLDAKRRNDAVRPDPKVIRDVLRMILADTAKFSVVSSSRAAIVQDDDDAAVGSSTEEKEDEKEKDSICEPLLTRDLVRSIFATYGETELVKDDELIDEMILAASNGEANAVLNEETFLHALTDDVKLYDVNREFDATTHYYDVFQTEDSTKNSSSILVKQGGLMSDLDREGENEKARKSKIFENEEEESCAKTKVAEIERVATAASIDYTAETFRSHLHVIISWVSLIFTYVAYMFGNITISTNWCSSDSYGCDVLSKIISFLYTMVTLSIAGGIFIGLASVGNNIFSDSIWQILVGVVAISVFTVLPYIFENDYGLAKTVREDDEKRILGFLSLLTGLILIFLQCLNFLRILIKKTSLKTNKILTAFFTGSNARAESYTKQASTYKVNLMVKNALSMHGLDYKKTNDHNDDGDENVNEVKESAVESRKREVDVRTEENNEERDENENEDKESDVERSNKMTNSDNDDWEENENKVKKSTNREIDVFIEETNRVGLDETSHGRAMLQFDRQMIVRESCGGFMWAWKHWLSGNLARTHGIWIHSRIFAGSLAQFFVIIAYILISMSASRTIISEIYQPAMSESVFYALDLDNSSTVSREEAKTFPLAAMLEETEVYAILKTLGATDDRLPSIWSIVGYYGERPEADVNKLFGEPIDLLKEFNRMTNLTLTADQYGVIDRNQDGLGGEDLKSLVVRAFGAGRSEFAKSGDMASWDKEKQQRFWQVLQSFDFTRAGVPDPDYVDGFLHDWTKYLQSEQGFWDEVFADTDFPADQASIEERSRQTAKRLNMTDEPIFRFQYFDQNSDGILVKEEADTSELAAPNPTTFRISLQTFPAFSEFPNEDFDDFFRVFDRDQNGLFSAEDINRFVVTVTKEGGKVFSNTQVSNESLHEFLELTSKPEITLVTDAVIEFVFDLYDSDCSGEVTEKEAFIPAISVVQNVGNVGRCNSTSAYFIGSLANVTHTFDDESSEVDETEDENDETDRLRGTLFNDIDLTPKKWMLRLSLFLGTFVSVCVGILTALSYIPSSVGTVLQFRTGVIPSLQDEHFEVYRRNLTTVSSILGSMFWSLLLQMFFLDVVVVGFVFLLVWQGTRSIVLSFSAFVLGILINNILKVILTRIVGSTTYAAFYRKKPAPANIAILALECWHLGITFMFIVARAIKFIFAAAVFIGRIDRTFLAPDVRAIGPVNLDAVPNFYKQDLLSAEAHRHPYIERMGLMYMMKLRYGDSFARTSGSCWRLLFVFALMPWLRKYRILEQHEHAENVNVLKERLGQAIGTATSLQAQVATLMAEVKMLKTVKVQ